MPVKHVRHLILNRTLTIRTGYLLRACTSHNQQESWTILQQRYKTSSTTFNVNNIITHYFFSVKSISFSCFTLSFSSSLFALLNLDTSPARYTIVDYFLLLRVSVFSLCKINNIESVGMFPFL